jgi:hypothetical protein
MRLLRAVLVVAALATASTCGGNGTSPSARSDTAAPASIPVPVPPVTTPTTVPVAPTSPPPTTVATVPPTSVLPPPPATTTVATTIPTADVPVPDDITFGRPAPDLLDALPAEDIPWTSVGPEWMSLVYPRLSSDNSSSLDQRGLYLVDPDNRIYAVSALPNDGTDVVSVAYTGRVALLRGTYGQGLPLGVLDLDTTLFHVVVPASEQLDAVSLTRDGRGLWVYDVPWSNPPEAGGTIRLSRVDLTDGSWTTILEEPVGLDELVDYYDWWVNNRGSVVELPDGDIVTATPTGIWTGSPDGEGFERLDAPDAACAVVTLWDATTVVARCAVAAAADPDCGNSGLWLVSTDGRPFGALAQPDPDTCTGYGGAVALDGDLAVNAGFGSGECNSHVVLIGSDGSEQWVPPTAELRCMEHVAGIRNGAWLISAANPYVGRAAGWFEVTPSGSTPIDLPDGWLSVLVP